MWIGVEFQPNGPIYYYHSPYLIRQGQTVVVDVAGTPTLAVCRKRYRKNPYHKDVKSILGIVYVLADLEQPPDNSDEPSGIVGKVINLITGV